MRSAANRVMPLPKKRSKTYRLLDASMIWPEPDLTGLEPREAD